MPKEEKAAAAAQPLVDVVALAAAPQHQRSTPLTRACGVVVKMAITAQTALQQRHSVASAALAIISAPTVRKIRLPALAAMLSLQMPRQSSTVKQGTPTPRPLTRWMHVRRSSYSRTSRLLRCNRLHYPRARPTPPLPLLPPHKQTRSNAPTLTLLHYALWDMACAYQPWYPHLNRSSSLAQQARLPLQS